MESIDKSILDSISAHVAILDKSGRILQTNRAWNDFHLKNAPKGAVQTPDMNYLAVCESATGPGAEKAREVALGIKSVAREEIDEFELQYDCHGSGVKRWFNLRVTRLNAPGQPRLVVSHENITQIKTAEEKILQREVMLKDQAQKLEQANSALTFLLDQIKKERSELEEKVMAQIKHLALPYLNKLASSDLSPEQKALARAAVENLKEITSPFARSLSSRFLGLTPTEIQVAGLIKEGQTSKEIAEALNTSPRTVDFHRANLRRKLGLKDRAQNLRTYLLSLA
ncbi:LuxR C-terminal-related transcriptional regulator [Dethiosulfatarculus sandiegensis]|nr:LuxR C-terminal-related transcriptional regulator [Dethiosulfatarculus sandiegensis]